MNFTREPIIETIITPKEGFKLVLRNTKGANPEEYCVDAVEVVSFGNSIFYRSLERPKSFLLPVSDYEIQESREARITLKNATLEKSVKIPSGNERSGSHASPDDSHHQEKKRERKKQKKKKEVEPLKEELQHEVEKSHHLGEDVPVVAQKEKESPPPTILSRLFPPPTNLISESISRYKQQEALAAAGKKDEIALVEKDREDLLESLEVQEKRLDHIWAVEEQPSDMVRDDSFEKVKHFQIEDEEVFFSPVDEEFEIAPAPLAEESREEDRANVFTNDLLPGQET